MFTDDDPNVQSAFERLKDALAAKVDPRVDIGESRLLAFVEGRLSAEDAERVSGQLMASPSLRAFLVDLRTPPTDAEVSRAIDAVTAATAPRVEPPMFDPFAPSAPTDPSLRLEGPFGGLRTVMEATEVPSLRFGAGSPFSLVARGSPSVAFVAREGGAIRIVRDEAVTAKGEARRIAAPVPSLFPAPGRWRVGFVAGVSPDDIVGLIYEDALRRFERAVWRVVEIDVLGG